MSSDELMIWIFVGLIVLMGIFFLLYIWADSAPIGSGGSDYNEWTTL